MQQFAKKFFICRTAWLYGDGKNFVKTMLRLSESHDEVSVVCDQLGSPTSAVELARMIRHLEGTENYGIFHATCEGDTNWADVFTILLYNGFKGSCDIEGYHDLVHFDDMEWTGQLTGLEYLKRCRGGLEYFYGPEKERGYQGNRQAKLGRK